MNTTGRKKYRLLTAAVWVGLAMIGLYLSLAHAPGDMAVVFVSSRAVAILGGAILFAWKQEARQLVYHPGDDGQAHHRVAS